MALLKFISLSVGSLMLLQGAYAATYSQAEAAAEDCSEFMNKARTEVGLPNFAKISEENKKYLTKAGAEEKFLKAVCELFSKDKTIILDKKTPDFNGATAAYSRTNLGCSAAVEEWKKGFSAFKNDNNSLPANFTEAGTDGSVDPKVIYGKAPYDKPDAVNFVALYNGQADATAECAVVTCTKTASGEDKALVCVTYPTALPKDKAPYDQTQWDNILKVFAPAASSASAAVPTVLALAAAAVGVALL